MTYGTRLLTPNAHRHLLDAKRSARNAWQAGMAALRALWRAVRAQLEGF